MDSIISHSPEETEAFALALAASLTGGAIFALCGDLGAGKTRFVRGLAAGLGIDPNIVSSPTFTLIHEYAGGKFPLCHFDFYRAGSMDELLQAGFDDYLRADCVLAIEWADKFPRLLPATARRFCFSLKSENEREISEVGVDGAIRFL